MFSLTKELITVEHPQLTVGELFDRIDAQDAPIRRSAHVGNQSGQELLLMTAAPPGLKVLLVDTIQGNDNFHENNPPKTVRLAGREPIPLCRKRAASGRIVGSIVVDDECLPKNIDLACQPIPGETLTSFHCRAIDMLGPANSPEIMTAFFARHADLFQATMTTAHLLGEVTRLVRSDGTIDTLENIDPAHDGIFGLKDTSPANEGTMLPLNGMMALDMAISAVADGSDRTTHLGGRHMKQYTKDYGRMQKVRRIFEGTLVQLGSVVSEHCYEVIDITGLASLVPSSTHSSQHQLLLSGNPTVDLGQHIHKPCAGL